jgi:hypothetical protein
MMKKPFIISILIGLTTSISLIFITYFFGIGGLLPLTIAANLVLYLAGGFAFGFFINKSKWWHFFIAGFIPYIFLYLVMLINFVYRSLLSLEVSLESPISIIILFALVLAVVYTLAGLTGKKFAVRLKPSV